MPRQNGERSIGMEARLATRIAYERERRGWTYDGLAQRVTEAGCAIQGSAIYKIEKGDPPRRVTVDELVGFSLAFDLSMGALLSEDWSGDPALARLLSDYETAKAKVEQAAPALRRATDALTRYALAHPAAMDTVAQILEPAALKGAQWDVAGE